MGGVDLRPSFYIIFYNIICFNVKNRYLYRVIKIEKDMTLATEVPFDFEYTYTPGEPATRDYPGDGPEVEIIKVQLNGVEIPLQAITTELYEEMVEQVINNYY